VATLEKRRKRGNERRRRRIERQQEKRKRMGTNSKTVPHHYEIGAKNHRHWTWNSR